MRHMGDGPDDDGDGIAKACADQIDDPAEAQITDRISRLEPEDDIGIIRFGPGHFRRQ
ncbi:hypothetical protein LTR94_038199, partial [Friedmanniomyces endolithicus]